MKNKEKKVYFKIILGYIIPTLITTIICYPLLPKLLNYPPNSINNSFQLKIVPTYYWIYYVIAVFIGIACEYLFLSQKFKIIKKLENTKKYRFSNKERTNLCKKIYNISNTASIELLLVPILILAIVLGLLKVDSLLIIKIIIVIFVIITVSISISYIYVKMQLKYFLDKLNNTSKPSKFSSLMFSTYIQFIPFTIASIMIVGLVILAQFSYKYSESLANINLNILAKEIEEKHIDNDIKLKEYIDVKMKDNIQKDKVFFYITNDNNIFFANNMECSTMFIEYFKEFSRNNGGRVYDYYGVESQGVVIYTPYSETIQAIGYRFDVIDGSVYIIFFITVTIILIFNIIILYFYSLSLKNEVNSITEKISSLNKEKNIGGIISITSNDEFGLLQHEYNNLQKTTQGYINELKEKQEVIVKQGQLVSIGELAGGVAHDINTPISAIKTGITMLNQKQDREESEKEILQRMDNCATKIINIVNSMRNQIRNLGGTTKIKFKVSDVINDIKVITYHEIYKNKSEFCVDIIDDLSVEGDPTKLGQVLTNLVVNAAQAYGDKGGKIDVTVQKAPKNSVLIKISDYAGGLDPEIKPYIFKNILTTKGTFGTGLGLYLAYSIIKGEFNGDISFESDEGMGTTFYISIPVA